VQTKSDLALYFKQDFLSSNQLTESEVKSLFESQSFENWKKSQENKDKLSAALLKGVNHIIKGLGVIAKQLAMRR